MVRSKQFHVLIVLEVEVLQSFRNTVLLDIILSIWIFSPDWLSWSSLIILSLVFINYYMLLFFIHKLTVWDDWEIIIEIIKIYKKKEKYYLKFTRDSVSIWKKNSYITKLTAFLCQCYERELRLIATSYIVSFNF